MEYVNFGDPRRRYSGRRHHVPHMELAKAGLVGYETGRNFCMEQQNEPSGTPKDATKVTEEQRQRQEQLDHRNEDPQAPGQHQDRSKVADET